MTSTLVFDASVRQSTEAPPVNKLPAASTQARLFMDTSPRSITIMVVLQLFPAKPDSTFRVQRPGPVALDSGVGKEPNAKILMNAAPVTARSDVLTLLAVSFVRVILATH